MNNVIPLRRAPELGDAKQPPHDAYAEAAVLTTCLLAPEKAAEAFAIAPATAYFWAAHRAIAESITDLVELGEPWDMTAVGVRLNETGKMTVLGGPGFLVEMANQIPAITSPRKYAERVRDLARIRELADVTRQLLAECYEPISNVGAFLSRVDSMVGGITRAGGRVRAISAMTSVKSSIRRLGEPLTDRIGTGMSDVDDMTMGFEPGTVTILAARPGMGKTAMALQLAGAATKAGHRTLFVSLEMGDAELMDRMLSAESGVPLQAFRRRNVSPTQWSSLTHTASRVAPLPLVIADAPGQTLLDIRATARQEHAKLVIVDHVGLMKAIAGSVSSRRSREQEVAEFSRGLKAIAKELRIPVLVLCQVTRDVAKAAKRPGLESLRESGSLEQDADNVWFLHRPGYYDPKASDEIKRQAELIIAKQRQGPTGIIPLIWMAEHTRFVQPEAY